MSRSPPPTPRPLGEGHIRRLVNASFALRAAADQNNTDETLTKENRLSLTYFVDPNTVIWYCRPFEDQNLSGLYKSSRPDDELGVQDDLPIAFATLDYIFSGDLPGAERGALCLSLPHAEELHGTVNNKIASGVGQRPQYDVKQLAAAVARFREAPEIGPELENIFDAVTGVLKNPILTATFAKDRFIDLVERRLIRRIDDYTTFLGDLHSSKSRLQTLKEELTIQWSDLLRKHKPKDVGAKTLLHDAETMALLQALNELVVGRERERRFLLITTDRAIHNAMATLLQEQGPETFNFVRHPRQYIPLLNLNSAPGRTRLDRNVFDRLQYAINELASAADGVVAKRPFGPEAHVISVDHDNGVSPNRWLLLADQAQRLLDEWNQAMRTATLMNVDALSTTTMRSLDAAVRLVDVSLNPVENDGVADKLEQAINEQADQIVRSNRAFSISGRFLNLARQGNVGPKGGKQPRMPALFRLPPVKRIDKFIEKHYGEGNVLFEDFLGWVIQQDDVIRSDILQELEDLLIDLEEVEAYAFSAAVAFRMREWRTALHFAQNFERAADGASRSRPNTSTLVADYLDEIRYCRYVSERFLLTDPIEIRRTRTALLTDCLKNNIGDFERARSSSELAALTLVFIFRSKMSSALVYDLRLLLGEANRWIGHGLRWSARAQSAANRKARQDMRRSLRDQLRTNAVAYHVFRAHLFEEAELVREDPAARKALKDLIRNTSPHAMSGLYQHALEAVLAKTQDEQRAALRDLSSSLIEAGDKGALSGELDEKFSHWFADIAQHPIPLAHA